MRCDEEQDLAALTGRQFALEHVSNDWNRSEAGRSLSRFAFGIGKHAAHDSGTAIWHQHFCLHALCVDARYATYCDTGVDSVVLDCNAENNSADIGNLR